MKTIWKILIGIIPGIAFPFLFPNSEILVTEIAVTILSIGKYLVFPLIFFTLTIAVCKLRREKKYWPVLLKAVITFLFITVILAVIGIFSFLILSPERIPIVSESRPIIERIGFQELLFSLFPENLFLIFTGNGSTLLPLVLFSMILGFYLYFDQEISEPTFNLFDSLSRLFYRMSSLTISFSGILLFFTTSKLVFQIRSIVDLSIYRSLLIMIVGTVLFLYLILIPLVFILLKKKSSLLPFFLSLTAPLMTALFSGDLFFSYLSLNQSSRENLMVTRKAGGFINPLGILFARPGTAMISAICSLAVLTSYSSLELTFFQIAWVFLFSILISFSLFSVPGISLLVSLSLISTLYGRGLEDGFLILIPIIPVLAALATMIDITMIGISTYLIASNEDLLDDYEMKYRI